MEEPELHIGVVGAGGFARFAVDAFLGVPGIRVLAVTDIDPAAAQRMAEEFGLVVHDGLDALLKDDRVQLVYIATPPHLHFAQSRMALLAGKHVICEKPAALKTCEAEELATLASARQLLWVVNLMQRYNPLYGMVKTIVDGGLLGEFLHGYFENYASDEFLGPRHWFWDAGLSGGIFIEHGVHFFDLFSGWLGEGKVVAALQMRRPGIADRIIDRVQAVVGYRAGMVNFYHGFDQPKLLDRQEMRLLFERGEITLLEWVPVKMRLHGILKDAEIEKLERMTHASAMVSCNNTEGGTAQSVRGRFKEIVFDRQVTIDYENPLGKQDLYRHILAAMIADQWKWIRDRKHVRVIDDGHAVESLRMAEAATEMAKEC